MYPQRLPLVNSDDGTWGNIIRQYLMAQHYNDDTNNPLNGSHQKVTIVAGTATAGTAPLKFTSGTVLATPEAGAVEFNADALYFTITTGTVRKRVAIYDDSAGANGDMYYRDSSGNFVRRAIGTAGQYMRVSGGVPTWVDSTFATSSKTANYTVSSSDTVVFADATSGNITITLPLASSLSGYRFYVKRVDGAANNCSVACSGVDTVDGQSSISIVAQYTSLTIVSNGSAWYII